MTYYRILLTHYSQKDSKTALACVVRAPSEEAVYRFIDRECVYGCWTDGADDEKEHYPREPLSEAGQARAASLGLVYTAEDFPVLSGPRSAMIQFCRGDVFEEPQDLYYGATQYEWEPVGRVGDGYAAPQGLETVLGKDRFFNLNDKGEVSK